MSIFINDVVIFEEFMEHHQSIWAKPHIRHAFKTGLAALMTILIYQLFELKHGYWAVITAIVIMQASIENSSYELTFKFAFYRLMGTVIGASIAFLLLLNIDFSPWGKLFTICMLIIIGSLITHKHRGFNLLGPTAAIILLFDHRQALTESFAFERVTEILLGATIAVFTTRFVLPYRLPQYIEEQRGQRLRRCAAQLKRLAHISHHQDPNWIKSQVSLLNKTRETKKLIKSLPKDRQVIERRTLSDEISLYKMGLRLHEALTKLPSDYWTNDLLQETTCKLILAMADSLEYPHTPHETALKSLTQASHAFQKAFQAYRQNDKASGITYPIDVIYYIFGVHQALCNAKKSIESLVAFRPTSRE